MATTTDLALELASLCDKLSVRHGAAGDAFLAEKFSVQPWTVEFFQIIHSIVARTHSLEDQLKSLNLNELVLADAANHLSHIRQAFTKEALMRGWDGVGVTLVGPLHSSPIRMLSGALKEEHRYPDLTPEERVEVSELVDELLGWLREKQLSERDFVRQSLIEGLEAFKFRLDRLDWFGWGYSIESLREVIAAYMALERGLDPVANPDAGAVLKKTAGFLQSVFGYAEKGKKVADTADWIVDCYRYVSLVAPAASGYIAGLLTSS